MNPQQRYDKKCVFFNFRFRRNQDKKYIEFLNKCENRTEFLRNAIDKEMR